MPKRIQMSRQRPWRADNPEAIIVARPSKWGNNYVVRRFGDEWAVGVILDDKTIIWAGAHDTRAEAFTTMLRIYRSLAEEMNPEELRGHDLACWCRLDDYCHGDVLLELANPTNEDPRGH